MVSHHNNVISDNDRIQIKHRNEGKFLQYDDISDIDPRSNEKDIAPKNDISGKNRNLNDCEESSPEYTIEWPSLADLVALKRIQQSDDKIRSDMRKLLSQFAALYACAQKD